MAKEQDEAVRTYLAALRDPESLRDDDKVSALKEQLESTDDPLERLKVRAELERAADIGPEDYEEGFIKHAQEWAKANDVPVSVFKAEGVPADVLNRAGFAVEAPKKAAASKSTGRSRVSSDTVRDAIRNMADTFTTSDIEEATGASYNTVRKMVAELQEAGTVEEIGPDPNHDSVGRAPTLYKVKS